MARIVVGSPNLTQPLLLYPGLGPAMLEQHRRSSQTNRATHKILLVTTESCTYWCFPWSLVDSLFLLNDVKDSILPFQGTTRMPNLRSILDYFMFSSPMMLLQYHIK
jgi:hypothetical protein